MSELLDFVNDGLTDPVPPTDFTDDLGNPIAPEVKKVDMEQLKALHVAVVEHEQRVAAVEQYKDATTISRGDAQFLAGRFPGLSQQLSLESFTVEPTRLNLKETLRYTQEELATFKPDDARTMLIDAVDAALTLRTHIADKILPRIRQLTDAYKERVSYDVVLRNKNLIRVSKLTDGKDEIVDLRTIWIYSDTLSRVQGLPNDLMQALGKLCNYVNNLGANAMLGHLTQLPEHNLQLGMSAYDYKVPSITILGFVRLMTNVNLELFDFYTTTLWDINDDLVDHKTQLETAEVDADLVTRIMSKCTYMNRLYDEFQTVLSVLLLCEPVVELVEM